MEEKDLRVRNILGRHGAMKDLGFTYRAGQRKMACTIEKALEHEQHVIVEGPTGTGKSVAYLVPGVLHALRTKGKMLVVTSGITLQEQLVKKDLPMLQKVLPPFTFALAKGRGNYACRACLNADWSAELMDTPDNPKTSDDEKTVARNEQIHSIKAWAEETKTGDMSELSFIPSSDVWDCVTRDSSECLGKACLSHDKCYYRKVKEASADATVIITNYHLMFISWQLAQKGVRLFPEFKYIVLDEGHNAAGIARDVFGVEVTCSQVLYACGLLKIFKEDLWEEVKRASWSFFHALAEEKLHKSRRSQVRLTESDLVPSDAFIALLDKVHGVHGTELKALQQKNTAASEWFCDGDGPFLNSFDREALRTMKKYASRMGRIKELGQIIHDCLALGRKEESVYYIDLSERCINPRSSQDLMNAYFASCYDWKRNCERKPRPSVPTRYCGSLHAKPVSAAPYFQSCLFHGGPTGAKTAVITSATLSVCSSRGETSYGADGPFAYIREDLGLSKDDGEGNIVDVADESSVVELVVDSPFDYVHNVGFVVPRGLPNPADERKEWEEAVIPKLLRILRTTQGRTLGLFTSKAMLKKATVACRQAKLPYRVLAQGDASRSDLIAQFREDTSSVLLGTDSFWTGVDVPGESLSCVIMDKIPFKSPSDPLLNYLANAQRPGQKQALGRGAFTRYTVPWAVIQFKQGFGRLIRTTTDRGVVVLLEPRLGMENSYGMMFFESLPEVAFTTGSITQMGAFLDYNKLPKKKKRKKKKR